MPHTPSRAQREAAFLALATNLYAELEDWYDQHPAASFAELVKRCRRFRGTIFGPAHV
jgi:hypothetical protein